MERGAPGDLEDQELVVLAQKGERQAFEVLVERYKKKAHRIAFDFTRDREEAKDLSQEAFLRAYIHLKGFDHRASFYTWFYRILVNLCLDYRRRRARISWQSLDERADLAAETSAGTPLNSRPEQRAMTGEISRKVGEALERLSPKQRTAFILRNNQGLSVPEIAKVMQAAEGTVKAHLHRAVAALRQSLAELM